MKSTTSTLSDIHPSYYAAAGIDTKAPAVAITRRRQSFGAILRLGEIAALLSVSALAVSSIYVTERIVVVSPPPAAAFEGKELHARLDQIGEILDYVLQKVSASSPASSSEPVSKKVCRVSVPKALLRTGPGKNFSPIMTLSGDSELLVQDETEGWFQVIAPTGQSAWVSRDVVTL